VDKIRRIIGSQLTMPIKGKGKGKGKVHPKTGHEGTKEE